LFGSLTHSLVLYGLLFLSVIGEPFHKLGNLESEFWSLIIEFWDDLFEKVRLWDDLFDKLSDDDITHLFQKKKSGCS